MLGSVGDGTHLFESIGGSLDHEDVGKSVSNRDAEPPSNGEDPDPNEEENTNTSSTTRQDTIDDGRRNQNEDENWEVDDHLNDPPNELIGTSIRR